MSRYAINCRKAGNQLLDWHEHAYPAWPHLTKSVQSVNTCMHLLSSHSYILPLIQLFCLSVMMVQKGNFNFSMVTQNIEGK